MPPERAAIGLVHKAHLAATTNISLNAYEDYGAFKLFLVDVGFLSCMARPESSALPDGKELFKEFNGALTEQYVLQQLKTTLRCLETYCRANERGHDRL